MVLDTLTRGTLEKIIDDEIAKIPDYVRRIRQVKSYLQIKEEADFIAGIVWAKSPLHLLCIIYTL